MLVKYLSHGKFWFNVELQRMPADTAGEEETQLFNVLHPATNDIITVPEYKAYALVNNYVDRNDAPPGRCPVCKRPMRLKAGQTKDDEHFYHVDSQFCPTKDPAARPYLNKRPRAPDAVAVAANRAWVANHLEQIYSRLHGIAPCLDFKEFISMLEKAASLNVYGYANYFPEHTPYVLVTLMNFLPSTSHKKLRKLKFMFFYDAAIESHDDLWIDRGFSSDLSRVSYRNGSTERSTKIDIDVSYVYATPTRTLSPAQKKWCIDVM